MGKKSASSPERIPSSLAPVMTPPCFFYFFPAAAAAAQFNSLLKLFYVAAHRQVAVMERAPESFDVVHLHPVDCFPTTSLYSDRPLFFFFFRHTHTVTGNSKRFTHATAIASRLIFIYKFDKLQLFYELIF